MVNKVLIKKKKTYAVFSVISDALFQDPGRAKKITGIKKKK